MKHLLSSLALFLLMITSQHTFAQSTTLEQTEEYAVINAFQQGKKNYISVTIGSVSTEEKEYEKEKNEKKFDMAPIIARMEELNKMGYVLFSSSTSIIPMSQGSSGLPFYTFVFIKKK